MASALTVLLAVAPLLYVLEVLLAIALLLALERPLSVLNLLLLDAKLDLPSRVEPAT